LEEDKLIEKTDVQFSDKRGINIFMKTYKGNMYDYIFEAQDYASKIIERRKEITRSFVQAFNDQIKTIIITGAGTSNFSPQSARIFIEKITGIPTYVVLPTEITAQEYIFNEHSLLIGISATGTSSNTIAALEYAKLKGAVTVAFTNDLSSPFAMKNEHRVFIDHGEEDCSPKSKSYICELITLSLCALELGLHINRITEEEYNEYIARITKTTNNLNSIATQSDAWYTKHSEEFKQCERMLVIGYGANKGNIKEGALKILECGRFQTSSYELEEFMHGIYHSINSDCYLLYVSNREKLSLDRSVRLMNYLNEFTEHQFLICNKSEGIHNERSLDIDFVDDPDFYFIEYVIPMQIIAYRIAVDKGINPNRPSDPLFHQKMNSKFL